MAQVVSCQSLTGGLGLIPGQSIWDLWWTKSWQWDMLLLQVLQLSTVSIVPLMQCKHSWNFLPLMYDL